MESEHVLRLRLIDLDVLDMRELQRSLPPGSYEIEREQLPGGQHGDLGLTEAIVVLIVPPVLQAITAWILKKRHRESVVLTIEKISPDNMTERHSLQINMSGSEPSEADVLKQVMSGMKLDPSILTKVVGESAQIPDGKER